MQRIKSEMLVYLLEHMQFEVNPNEFFQNKLNRGNFTWELLWKNQEICREPALEGVWSSFQQVCDCTSMEASMDFGHLAPDWKFVLTAGIPGIVNRLEEYAGQTQDPGKLEFYRCGQNVWRAIATLLRRMAESAKAIGGEKMEFVAANMLHLAEHAPETLAQAGVDPREIGYRMGDIIQAALKDPCCRTNPVKPDAAMLRKLLEEVTGRG
jgi:hypothetical protein